MIRGHRAAVQDLGFSPFLDNVLATASADCMVKVWVVPQEGLDEDMVDGNEHATLRGHSQAALFARWNPAANFTLASAGMDCQIKTWDVQRERSISSGALQTQPWSLEWNQDGQLLGSIAKDKCLHILDPRSQRKAAQVST